MRNGEVESLDSFVADGRLYCTKLKGLDSKAKMGLLLELNDASDAAAERCGRTPPRLPFVERH